MHSYIIIFNSPNRIIESSRYSIKRCVKSYIHLDKHHKNKLGSYANLVSVI